MLCTCLLIGQDFSWASIKLKTFISHRNWIKAIGLTLDAYRLPRLVFSDYIEQTLWSYLIKPECELRFEIPDGMNFDPVKCVKETFSRAGYAYRMNFDPPARRHICSGDSQITCLKWSLVHFQIAAKMNFAPLSYQWLHRKSKVDQSSFWRRFESGSNFILNTW